MSHAAGGTRPFGGWQKLPFHARLPVEEQAMASMNISLPDPMRDWVQDRIDSGKYASVSDYVRDLIRRDQTATDQREALVAALVEGEQSGVSSRQVTDIIAALRTERRKAGA
jgi:antitoxin ParD1/3/4